MPAIKPEMARAKEAAEAALLRRPGITGIDIGYKEVGGRETGVVAIRVLVAKKGAVSPAQMIPAEVGGFPTDVIERRFELQPLRIRVEDISAQAVKVSTAPLCGGMSIGPCRVVDGYVYVGTLGAVMRDKASGKPMLLSNYHVLCIDSGFKIGDPEVQPGRPDGGNCPANVVGALRRQVRNSRVDCAVADVRGKRRTACEITDIGPIAGTSTAQLGDAVRKHGRTTGLTYGKVDSVHLSMSLDYGAGVGTKHFKEQIGIKPDAKRNAKFGDHGDSGSVVVNDAGEIVALHFAGDDTGYGIANQIGAVMEELGVEICGGRKTEKNGGGKRQRRTEKDGRGRLTARDREEV